jgi:ubiquinone/menaquinone biosynthesis C-methylase UbiE
LRTFIARRVYQSQSDILKKMPEEDAQLGRPSLGWGEGQKRRLKMVQQVVPLEGKKILDAGCGIGIYLGAFQAFTEDVWGVEVDEKRAHRAKEITPNVSVSPAEKLPFPDNCFDIVFSNEVLEHVENDRQAVEEAVRVLRTGGHLVIFAPNRLFPFETHGVYLGKKYLFGNIPLINYLPDRLRDKLAHHAKAYRKSEIKSLFDGLPLRIVVFTQLFPAFDKLSAKIPPLKGFLKRVVRPLEKTPLKAFGLSHFIIAKKTA